MKTYPTIKKYILAQPPVHQATLLELYELIKASAPDATEAIKYGIPTFVGKKNLLHFGLAKKHIGFYPTSSAISYFAKDLAKYHTSKGAIQIPLDRPLPKSLITKITKFRVKEDVGG